MVALTVGVRRHADGAGFATRDPSLASRSADARMAALALDFGLGFFDHPGRMVSE